MVFPVESFPQRRRRPGLEAPIPRTKSSSSSRSNSSNTANLPTLEFRRKLALQALAVTVPNWSDLNINAAAVSETIIQQHITALLLVRLVAVLGCSQAVFSNLSTSWICQQTLLADHWWPPTLTTVIVSQLQALVQQLLSSSEESLPYHNLQRVHHVVLSTNKLLDLLLNLDKNDFLIDPPATFGLRQDPLAWFALLFSSLVGQCQHPGVSNSQLVHEDHPWALLYNDHSMNQHRALQGAFGALLQPDYRDLKQTLFPDVKEQDGDYRFFRSTVVQLVLATDIASPERAQISKSKWKEAFGSNSYYCSSANDNANNNNSPNNGDSFDDGSSSHKNVSNNYTRQRPPRRQGSYTNSTRRRGSLASDISKPRVRRSSLPKQQQQQMLRMNRRGSNASNDASMVSEMTCDSYNMMMNKQQQSSPMSNDSGNLLPALDDRSDPSSQTSSKQSGSQPSSLMLNKIKRRNSTQSYNTNDDSFNSFAQESIGLARKRQDGQAHTTRRGQQQRRMIAQAKTNAAQLLRQVQDDDSNASSNASISLTPPSSEDENEYAPVRGVMVTRSAERLPIALTTTVENGETTNTTTTTTTPTGNSSSNRPSLRRVSRRASTGNVPVRFASLKGQSIAEDAVINESFRKIAVVPQDGAKPSRRASATGVTIGSSSYQHRKRLGILRSMDFSGESIEVYNSTTPAASPALPSSGGRRRASLGGAPLLSGGMFGATGTAGSGEELYFDEPDELRASVVLELLLRAADVAHCLQGWEQMAKWSSCLFEEMAAAYKAGRGPNPAPGWFDNQTKALESYVLPLAYQLDETGVFGEFVGAIFAQGVEQNRDNWLVSGFELTQQLREKADL